MARNWIAYGWAAVRADDAREARQIALLQDLDWQTTEVQPVEYPERAWMRVSPVGVAWASVAGSVGTLAVSVFLKVHTGHGLAGRIVDLASGTTPFS